MVNKLIIENFFKDKEKNWKKEYLLDAKDYKNSFYSHFKLIIKKKENDLIITIQLYGWSNDKQKYVPLKQIEYYKTKDICRIKEHYEPIIEKFIRGLSKYLNYNCDLKEFIHTIENPSIKYHYKLLNTFTKEELDKIRATFRNIPRLNICEFYQGTIDFPNIFEVDYCNGFYANRIEVAVDLDDSDYATIYDLSDYDKCVKVSKKKALKKLLKIKG
jgi:hypothetical protein